MSETMKCEICGEPMPEGEEIFKFHWYSGPCPAPPLPREQQQDSELTRLRRDIAAARAEVEAMRDALMDAQTYLPVYAPDACHDCQHSSCMKRRTELDELHAKISRALAAQEGAGGHS